MIRSPRFWLFMGFAVAAAGSGASWLSQRIKPGLVDWNIARSVAMRLTSRPGDPDLPPAPGADYTGMVESSRQAVGEYLGRGAGSETAGVEVLDRRSWVEVNLANFQDLLEPFEDSYRRMNASNATAARLLSGLTRLAVSAQLGGMIGYLSRRVLGQYDIPLFKPGAASIYLVDVNIDSLAAKIGVNESDLRQWVVLHETTHAVEFESIPWLREHMAGLLREYLSEAGDTIMNPARIRERLGSAGSDGVRGLRLSGLLRMMLTDRQVEIVSRIQALMSVVEGYSNHAMHGTGEYLIPDYQTLAHRMKLREKSRGVGFRVISRLLGLDLKLEQYVIGENFVDHVVEQRGVEFVNRVWDSPDQLPSLEEVRAPERWIRRIESE